MKENIKLFNEYVEINEKIEYWIDIWEDYIEDFIEESNRFHLINPQITIQQIIDEINFNEFKNNENKKFLYKQIDYILKNDLSIRKKFLQEFNLIRRTFNLDKNLLLLQYCNNVMPIFEKGEYYYTNVDILNEILNVNEWRENDDAVIKSISQFLIIELLIKGYNLDTIKTFPMNILHTYRTTENGFLYTLSPVKVAWENDNDYLGYNEQLKSKIDNLSIRNRIDLLKLYFRNLKESNVFIFRIEGVKGETDIVIGDVNFYSPKLKRYVTKSIFDDKKNRELFRQNENTYFINAAVNVEYYDTKSGKALAIEKIDKALNILLCFYSPKTTLKVIKEEYIIVNDKGVEIGSGWGIKDGVDLFYDSLDLKIYNPLFNNEKFINFVTEFIFNPLSKQSKLEQKITNSIHWYRKAKEANRYEDKILAYWIIIENLLEVNSSLSNSVLNKNQQTTKYTIAKSIIPSIILLTRIWNIGKEVFSLVDNTVNPIIKNKNERINLPDELLIKCNLSRKSGKSINVTPFIANLSEIAKYTNSRSTKEKINYAERFYHDKNFAKKEMIQMNEYLQNDILQIYKLRNLIVHNAHFETSLLPYYSEVANALTGYLLVQSINYMSNRRDKKLEDFYIEKVANLNIILERLERENLFELTFKLQE